MQLVHPKYNRITIDADVCFGKPCIRGMRMPVASVLDYLASGMSIEEVLADFDFLEREDIYQALAFAAEAMQERYIPFGKAS
ncbi:hypothetical protein BH09BAC1_BH09BAC1_26230 [soil metagenome]